MKIRWNPKFGLSDLENDLLMTSWPQWPRKWLSDFFQKLHFQNQCIPTKKMRYSSVPNRRACRFIIFEKKIHPCTALFWFPRLLFFRKNSPSTFISSCTCIVIYSAPLSILRKNSSLHGLDMVCTFNVFLRIFQPACLFPPKRLFGTLK